MVYFSNAKTPQRIEGRQGAANPLIPLHSASGRSKRLTSWGKRAERNGMAAAVKYLS
jgi:hypothetical protein